MIGFIGPTKVVPWLQVHWELPCEEFFRSLFSRAANDAKSAWALAHEGCLSALLISRNPTLAAKMRLGWGSQIDNQSKKTVSS